ncbi:hypothetical protein K3H53_14145 [Aeromonas veronii]|uniref:hypothetical protein n=1 Tax=Aeromonas veronii TaxID=654 RepID=UPI001F1DE71D|nr:hypothetical protein [Aeromonas veronii]MCF5848437.1 hypothetical protein [Aeromonas veronii]
MAKRTKFQLKKAASKRAAQHLDKLVGGMAAIISAYLLAIATKLIVLNGLAVYTPYIGTFSLVLLVLFKILSFYEAEGDMKDNNPLGIIFAIGLTSSLITYLLILWSINEILVAIAMVTFCVGLLPFIWAFKSES